MLPVYPCGMSIFTPFNGRPLNEELYTARLTDTRGQMKILTCMYVYRRPSYDNSNPCLSSGLYLDIQNVILNMVYFVMDLPAITRVVKRDDQQN